MDKNRMNDEHLINLIQHYISVQETIKRLLRDSELNADEQVEAFKFITRRIEDYRI